MTPEERAVAELAAIGERIAELITTAPTLTGERRDRVRRIVNPPKTPRPEPKHRAP